jgi:hypothetical protein
VVLERRKKEKKVCHRMNFCFVMASEQILLPATTLTDWFSYPRGKEFTSRYEMSTVFKGSISSRKALISTNPEGKIKHRKCLLVV